jgi:hypothetical protein
VRSTAAPYTESRLTHLVRNKCVGFPVVEQVRYPLPGSNTTTPLLLSKSFVLRAVGIFYALIDRKPNWVIEFLRFTDIFTLCLYLTVGPVQSICKDNKTPYFEVATP